MANQAHTIEITILPNGKIQGEVKGVKGKECGPLTKWLDEIGEVTVDKQTPDYFKPSDQALTNRH